MANKEFNKDFVKKLQEHIGISIKPSKLLKEALTHRSFRNENKDANYNERLEFIGDAVLELAVTEFLFEKYPEHPEGDLTSFRSALVRTESLALEASKIKLGDFLFLSGGEEATGGREREYILANAFEALIGFLYLDKNYDVVKKFIEEHICYKINEIVEQRLDLDAKSRLQEKVQEKVKITPTYKLLEAYGPDHNKVFKMALMVGSKELTVGEGKSKQLAEQDAANKALNSWEDILKSISK